MVTWDGDQVLQLLLQVHDVIAELDVIHPGERGQHRTTGHIDRTLYILSTTPASNKEDWWEGSVLCEDHTGSLEVFHQNNKTKTAPSLTTQE